MGLSMRTPSSVSTGGYPPPSTWAQLDFDDIELKPAPFRGGFAALEWTQADKAVVLRDMGQVEPKSALTDTAKHGRWKLILRRDGKIKKGAMLFDLHRDPGETVNLIDSSEEIARRLRSSLDDLDAVIDHRIVPSLDDEALEKLRALGYVE